MPQGHLNILEPGENLLQHNRSLAIKAGQTAIKRGSVVVEDSGTWRLATTAGVDDAGTATVPGPLCYWSLQDQEQPDVLMAGKLTAMPCVPSVLLETDQIKAADGFAVGTFVQAGDDDGVTYEGVIKLHADGLTAIGIVMQTKTSRWSNDRLANTALGGAQRTGATVTAVQIRTVYIPHLSTA